MALWWFEVRLKFGKCDKCLNDFRTKPIHLDLTSISLEPARTQLSESARIFMKPLISKSYDQFAMALWWFEVRLKFGKCDKCLNVNSRTKSILSILDSHIVGTSKDQLSESARTLMIAFGNCSRESAFRIHFESRRVMINLLWLSDDLKLGWNLGNVTNVWTSISERNLSFRYLIRTSLEPARN